MDKIAENRIDIRILNRDHIGNTEFPLCPKTMNTSGEEEIAVIQIRLVPAYRLPEVLIDLSLFIHIQEPVSRLEAVCFDHMLPVSFGRILRHRHKKDRIQPMTQVSLV